MKTSLAFMFLFLMASVVEVGHWDGFRIFPQAEARIGRPLTPISVAGVARRTVRRCAYGVYYCQIQNNKAVPATALEPKKT